MIIIIMIIMIINISCMRRTSSADKDVGAGSPARGHLQSLQAAHARHDYFLKSLLFPWDPATVGGKDFTGHCVPVRAKHRIQNWLVVVYNGQLIAEGSNCLMMRTCIFSVPLLYELEWKTVEELVAHESNMMVFISLHGMGSRYTSSLFIRNSQLADRDLRNAATDFRVPKRKSNAGQKSFSYRGAKVWNSFSVECKQVSSLRKLKPLLNRFLTSSFYCIYRLDF